MTDHPHDGADETKRRISYVSLGDLVAPVDDSTPQPPRPTRRSTLRPRVIPAREPKAPAAAADLEAEADELDALTAADLERIDAESEHVVIERAAIVGDWHQW